MEIAIDFSVVRALLIVFLITIQLFLLAYKKRFIRIHSNELRDELCNSRLFG